MTGGDDVVEVGEQIDLVIGGSFDSDSVGAWSRSSSLSRALGSDLLGGPIQTGHVAGQCGHRLREVSSAEFLVGRHGDHRERWRVAFPAREPGRAASRRRGA